MNRRKLVGYAMISSPFVIAFSVVTWGMGLPAALGLSAAVYVLYLTVVKGFSLVQA